MIKRAQRKSWVIGIATSTAILVVTYLLTLGHCFLPVGSFDFSTERIEVREYSPFMIYPSDGTIQGGFRRLKWQIFYPGRARMVAAADALNADPTSEQRTLKDLMISFGYPFPDGTETSPAREVRGLTIVNYPSVLKRIERDLRLEPTFIWQPPPDPQPAFPP